MTAPPAPVPTNDAPLPVDRRGDAGPFDIIGDVHGCARELGVLLAALGYTLAGDADRPRLGHPAGRRLVFAGDLVNRGPDTPAVLRLAMAAQADGIAHAVEGNHDALLRRWLAGETVAVNAGLQKSIDQLAAETAGFRTRVHRFLSRLPSHCWLDGGRLAVVHAGIEADMLGRDSSEVRELAVFGGPPGRLDAQGLPQRSDWVARYRGDAAIVYGHTPVRDAQWVGNTICIDTGCVAGGRLTALRWPERQLVDVPAHQTYSRPARPFLAGGRA